MEPAQINRIEELYIQHRDNPYPLYEQWRALGPVLSDADGKIIVVGYTDSRAALVDPAISVDGRHSRWYKQRADNGEVTPEEEQRFAEAPFIEMDPPEHTRHRVLVSQAFASRAAKAGPRVQQVVDDRIASLAANEADMVRDFAYTIPIRVLCELFNIDSPQERQQIQDWSHFISRSMDPSNPVDPADVDKVSNDFRGYIDRLVAQRAANPGDDIVSALLSSDEGGQKLTPTEVTSAIWLLLVSGHETTSSLIASGLHSLVTDPALADRLRADPGKMPAFVDELLRLTPLVQFLWRHVKDDTTLPCGAKLSAGDTVVIVLAAANRDPEHFPKPDAIDLDGQGPQALSFGAGVHYCLGATLGRLQTAIALNTFLQRVAGPEITDELPNSPLSLGGLTALPIKYTPVPA